RPDRRFGRERRDPAPKRAGRGRDRVRGHQPPDRQRRQLALETAGRLADHRWPTARGRGCPSGPRTGEGGELVSLFGRNKNKGKPPPGDPPAKLVEEAFMNLRVHVRLLEQGVIPSHDYCTQL